MEPLIFVDADSLYFRICFKTKKKNEIRKYINAHLDEIHGDNMMGQMLIAVKGYGNWRKNYYPDYKANRPELDDDMKRALTYAHSYLVNKKKAIMADGMEADDLVSIWAHEAMKEDKPYVIAGIDKDLLQIPGNHYNYVKKEHQFIDTDQAHYNLMKQCLIGDSSDNIPGIKGIGPKKAEKIFGDAKPKRLWTLVRAAWKLHNAGDPKISYNLLKMLSSFDQLTRIQQCLNDTNVPTAEIMQKIWIMLFHTATDEPTIYQEVIAEK